VLRHAVDEQTWQRRQERHLKQAYGWILRTKAVFKVKIQATLLYHEIGYM
jgi:hypothetical protein